MRRYPLFVVPLLAFFSPSVYQDAAWRWRGAGFIYLFLLLAVCWIPSSVVVHRMVGQMIEKDAAEILAEAPTLKIINGQASIDKPEPYFLRNPQNQDVLVAIDTTGKINSLDDTEALVLITKRQAFFRKNAMEIRTFKLREIDGVSIDPAVIRSWLEAIRPYIAPVLCVALVLGSFFYRVIQVVLYAVIGLVFSSMTGSTRTFGSLVRLSVVAITPVIVLSTAMEAAGAGGKMPWWGWFAMAMFYLFFGVRAAAAEPEEELVEARAI